MWCRRLGRALCRLISMSWRGRGIIIGVLVLTNCCSVVLVPALFEAYSVSSAQQSAGVSVARTTATPLVSTSSTSQSLVPHGPRPSIRRLTLHTGLAAFPCCTSTWWFHVLHVLALSGTTCRADLGPRRHVPHQIGLSRHASFVARSGLLFFLWPPVQRTLPSLHQVTILTAVLVSSRQHAEDLHRWLGFG